MTAGMIVGLIFLPLAWMLLAAANKSRCDETGVNAPTRDGMRRIRRKARKKGISEAEAYNQWLNRKTSKLPKSAAAYDFSYAPDTRTKPTPSAEDVAWEKADEPLKALAKARRISVHGQFNGLYHLLDHGSWQGVTIKNPARPDETNFTREEVVTYLMPDASHPPVQSAATDRKVNASPPKKPTSPGDGELMALATARNCSLHRQTNGKYYILNLNRSPTAFVTKGGDPARHELTREEAARLLDHL